MFITLQINQHPNITEKIVKMFITFQINQYPNIIIFIYGLCESCFTDIAMVWEETWLKSIPHQRPQDPSGISKVRGRSELGVHGQGCFDTVELGAAPHHAWRPPWASQNFMEDKISLTANKLWPGAQRVDPQRDVRADINAVANRPQEMKQDQGSVATLGF